jgi:hypothetical protein
VNGDFDRAWLYQDALRPIAEIDAVSELRKARKSEQSRLTA